MDLANRRERWAGLFAIVALVTACSGGGTPNPSGSAAASAGGSAATSPGASAGGSTGAVKLPAPDSVGEPLPDSVTAARPYRIGFSFPQIEIPYFISVSYGAAEECKRLKITCIFTFGGGFDKPEAQVQDVEELLGQGVDGLSINAASTDALVPILEPAIQKGIVVTAFGAPFTGDFQYHGFFGVSHYEKGETFTNSVVKCLREKGLETAEIVAIGSVAGSGSYTPVEQAYKDILGTGENAGYKIVYHQYTNQTREDAIRVTEDALSVHPDPDGLLAGAPEIGQGAEQVLKERNFNAGDVCMSTGGGWDAASEKSIREGWYYEMAVEQAVINGQQNIRKTVAHLNGDDVPFFIPEPLVVIGASNIDSADLSGLASPAGYTPVALVEP